MKNIIITFIACLPSLVFSQEMVDFVYLQSFDQAYFETEFGAPAVAGVDQYRAVYTTTNIEGNLDTVSGLVCIPQLEGYNFGIVSYSHGTVGSRFEVPGYLSSEESIPSLYSSLGAVAIAPDYLGLGYDDGIHPYIHADSEAWVNYDMLLAVKAYLPEELGIDFTNQLFITGYSQGGHAAMAFHKYLQENTAIDVSASFPMSGPYSISTGMKDLILSEEEYFTVSYLASVLVSYQYVYGNIYPDGELSNLIKEPYVNIIQTFENGNITLWNLNTALITLLENNAGGVYPKEMIRDEVLNAIIEDENHPINVALRDNDVYDWAPETYTRLLYCTADDQVAYENSLIAQDTMQANGANDVLAIDMGPTLDHGQCVQPAVTNMVFYLLFNLELAPSSANDLALENINIFPNPNDGSFTIAVDHEITSPYSVKIYNLVGEVVYNQPFDVQERRLDLDVANGMYFLVLEDVKGHARAIQKIVVEK